MGTKFLLQRLPVIVLLFLTVSIFHAIEMLGLFDSHHIFLLSPEDTQAPPMGQVIRIAISLCDDTEER